MKPPRRVEPHHVITSHGRWYLVAWDLEHDDWRIFRADRITPRTPTGPRFKGSDEFNVWPCAGTVILHLPASAILPFAGDNTVETLGPAGAATPSDSGLG